MVVSLSPLTSHLTSTQNLKLCAKIPRQESLLALFIFNLLLFFLPFSSFFLLTLQHSSNYSPSKYRNPPSHQIQNSKQKSTIHLTSIYWHSFILFIHSFIPPPLTQLNLLLPHFPQWPIIIISPLPLLVFIYIMEYTPAIRKSTVIFQCHNLHMPRLHPRILPLRARTFG